MKSLSWWGRRCVFAALAAVPMALCAVGYGLFLVPLPVVGLFFSYAAFGIGLVSMGSGLIIVVVLVALLVRFGRYRQAVEGLVLYFGTYAGVALILRWAVRGYLTGTATP